MKHLLVWEGQDVQSVQDVFPQVKTSQAQLPACPLLLSGPSAVSDPCWLHLRMASVQPAGASSRGRSIFLKKRQGPHEFFLTELKYNLYTIKLIYSKCIIQDSQHKSTKLCNHHLVQFKDVSSLPLTPSCPSLTIPSPSPRQPLICFLYL